MAIFVPAHYSHYYFSCGSLRKFIAKIHRVVQGHQCWW